MIDEAGDKAALTAKINKIDEDIKEAQEIKSAIPSNINHYVDPEIIGDLMEDMDNSIKELEEKKKDLEDQLKAMDKPVKERKMTKGEKTKKEKTVKAMKKSDGFDKYGKDAEKVMYATATKQAMK
jgi:peptidoglycan hydrolase CwlO-like protein